MNVNTFLMLLSLKLFSVYNILLTILLTRKIELDLISVIIIKWDSLGVSGTQLCKIRIYCNSNSCTDLALIIVYNIVYKGVFKRVHVFIKYYLV